MMSLTLQDCIFPCGLILYVDEVNANNSVSRSPFLIPFTTLFILKVDTISNLKSGFVSCQSLLSSCESVFVQCLFGNS